MSITTAIGDLFHSVYELFASFFGAIYHIFTSVFGAVAQLFSGFFELIANVFGGLVDLIGGIGKFVFANIVLIGVVAVAGFAYVNYQKQQGRSVKPVTAGKKAVN